MIKNIIMKKKVDNFIKNLFFGFFNKNIIFVIKYFKINGRVDNLDN